jgi:excisionase family DNA binding protein
MKTPTAVSGGARLVTVSEAAKRLGLKDKTIRFWIWQRRIEFIKVGSRSVRISEHVIDEIIQQGTVPTQR